MTLSALDSLLTGPLLTTPAMQAVFADEARLRAMLRTEAALARVQSQHGLIPETLAAALDAITPPDPAAIGRATALSGVPTIPFVKALQSALPPDLERHVHKGATTQDILDTALILQYRDALDLLTQDLLPTLYALASMARTHRDTPCVGRTYGQHAAPITFGFKAATWLAGIAEAADRLPHIRKTLLVASLGGPVGTLASLGTNGPPILDAFAHDLGLGTTPIAWHTRRARIAEAGTWLALLIGTLAKLATDIANLASTEIAEVAEPYIPGRGGSSSMPHKRNPVSCTVILAAHAAAPGLAMTLLSSMAAAHERPAGLWHAEWHVLPALFGLAAGALHEARTLAEGLEIDPARMRATIGITNGLLFADAAAARLTPTLGRDAAHHAVEHAAAEVRRTARPLQDILTAAHPAVDLAPAFDLTPACQAAGLWVDRALQDAELITTRLQEGQSPCP